MNNSNFATGHLDLESVARVSKDVTCSWSLVILMVQLILMLLIYDDYTSLMICDVADAVTDAVAADDDDCNDPYVIVSSAHCSGWFWATPT